jgi:hypothetical protein
MTRLLRGDHNERFVLHHPLRIFIDFALQGTWQFISAALLRNPQRIQTIEDDRESAIHVLTWVALRYTKHNKLAKLSSYLKIYDEVDCDESDGLATGGQSKGDNFSNSKTFPTFASDPLNRLLIVARKTFSARYGEAYPDDETQQAKDDVAEAEANPAMDAAKYRRLAPYIYISRLEALKKPNWLVEVFNEHLESDDWPAYDKAVANDLTSGTDSAHKRNQDKAKLEDRVSSSNSKRRRV